MTKQKIFITLLDKIQSRGLLTVFIKDLFDYEELNDYNYIYRLTKDTDSVIMDIYDNISANRFNRYIFSFEEGDYDIKTMEDKNVFVTKIHVLNVTKPDTKLLKLVYMLNLDNAEMVKYADSFLDKEIVKILSEIIK